MSPPFVVLIPVIHALGLDPGVPSSPTESDDGSLEVEVLAPGSLDQVRAALQDPVARSRLFPSVHDVQVLRKDGACTDLRLTTDGVTSPFVYDMRSCQTAQGWRDTLLHSDDMEVMDASWQLQPTSAGVEVRYRLHVSLSLPIPRYLVSGRQGKDMTSALAHLIHKLGF